MRWVLACSLVDFRAFSSVRATCAVFQLRRSSARSWQHDHCRSFGCGWSIRQLAALPYMTLEMPLAEGTQRVFHGTMGRPVRRQPQLTLRRWLSRPPATYPPPSFFQLDHGPAIFFIALPARFCEISPPFLCSKPASPSPSATRSPSFVRMFVPSFLPCPGGR